MRESRETQLASESGRALTSAQGRRSFTTFQTETDARFLESVRRIMTDGPRSGLSDHPHGTATLPPVALPSTPERD